MKMKNLLLSIIKNIRGEKDNKLVLPKGYRELTVEEMKNIRG